MPQDPYAGTVVRSGVFIPATGNGLFPSSRKDVYQTEVACPESLAEENSVIVDEAKRAEDATVA
jgi:hypothetical protein